MNITVLPIRISQMPLDSLGRLWSDGYSHADDILHLTPSLSRILEARQLWAVHSTFDLSACLGLICLAYIFCHSFHPAVHPPPFPPPPTWMPQTFPPSAAIVISLPSTGPLIRLGWHVPRLYHTRRKWNPEPIYGGPPPPPPMPLPPCSLSLSLTPSSRHLLLLPCTPL